MQRLCITIAAPTTAGLREARDRWTDADLIELRLDTVADPDVAGALADRRRPVVVTCRPRWEGGAFRGSEEERKQILAAALALGAEYVDVEARAGFDDLMTGANRRRIVLSYHDFEGVPADLTSRARAMAGTGAAVVKIAVQTSRLRDSVSLLEFGRAWDPDPPLVLIGMGEAGAITRAWPSRFGSLWSYAGPLDEVGQLRPERLLGELRFRDIDRGTALYGIVGRPVAHSVSPAMHNAAFRAAGLDAVYLPLAAADIDDFVACARAFGLRGANVTIPFKVAMAGRVDRLSEPASRIGAVNTIRVEDDGGWTGGNTDANGFLEPLANVPLAGRRASLLGAGGAARAVAVALAGRGARVTVHARDRRRAEEVAALAQGLVGGWPPGPGDWDLLVNCTPVGMHPHDEETPLPARLLGRGLVYDLVYNPVRTRLLQEAARAGCRTISGLAMLIGQAREAFEWWTGRRPPVDVMREAALARLGGLAPIADGALAESPGGIG